MTSKNISDGIFYHMFFVILLIVCSPIIISAQDRMQDVVYLKNGSIIRGTVVEQVIDKSLKIKTSDGNVFQFAMDEVQKIAKEAVEESEFVTASSPRGELISRSGDWGMTLAFWSGGEEGFSEGVKIDKKGGFLFRTFYDYYVVEKFAVGMYSNVAPISYEFVSEGAVLYEIGVSLKARFRVNSIAIKPGLCLGWCQCYGDKF